MTERSLKCENHLRRKERDLEVICIYVLFCTGVKFLIKLGKLLRVYI